MLNASRHHGERDLTRASPLSRSRVLNASRHHGERDGQCHHHPQAALGAQRLSASRRAGQDVFAHVAQRLPPCSTPLGITASGTPMGLLIPQGRYPRAQRLSASRRAGPTARSRASTATSSAQRLSASRRAGPPYAENNQTACQCAQRLSASRRAGRALAHGLHRGRVVLNASRHHGERDENQCRPPSGGSRAQRLSASRRAGRTGRS